MRKVAGVLDLGMVQALFGTTALIIEGWLILKLTVSCGFVHLRVCAFYLRLVMTSCNPVRVSSMQGLHLKTPCNPVLILIIHHRINIL